MPGLGSTDSEPRGLERPAALIDTEGAPSGDGLMRAVVGDLVGRYVLLDVLGQGAMGVVYSAFDPELDRKVAVKVLLPGVAGGEHSRIRLQREAQALARLSHPNVVAIHDVGTHDGQVYLAMEFVAGSTLGRWREAAKRPVQEVLEIFVQAGEGLSAAHEHGLVHRDFKPDNVMIDERGRVRVMDFGLARAASTLNEGEPETVSGARRALAVKVTNAGTLMGTPAYMAPEQLTGEEVTARSDQFSFCVALYEALFGTRPFAGDTLPELAANVLGGQVRRPPARTAVPLALRRVVLRGLRSDPEARWPSMDALVTALRRNPYRRRRVVFASGAALIVAAAGLGAVEVERRGRLSDCDAEASVITDSWNPQLQAKIAAAFEVTGTPLAGPTIERVHTVADAWVEAWSDARREVCVDTEVDARIDPAVAQGMRRCLDDSRDALEVSLTLLTAADKTVVQNAVLSLQSLPRVRNCTDPDWVSLRPALPETSDELRAVEAGLREAQALRWVGRSREALALLEGHVRDAERIGEPTVASEAQFDLATTLDLQGKHVEARNAYERAYAHAIVAGYGELGLRAASGMVSKAYDLADYDAGMRWYRIGRAYVERLGLDEHVAVAGLYSNAAELLHARGDVDEALALQERAVSIYRTLLGETHPHYGFALSDLGALQLLNGKYDDAEAQQRRAIEVLEHAFGPDHPRVSYPVNNLGMVAMECGEPAKALPYFERSAAIDRTAAGTGTDYAADLNNIGLAHYHLGHLEEARKAWEETLAIKVKIHGEDHPGLLVTQENLAALQVQAGALDEALAGFRRALAIRRQLGAEHAETARTLNNIGTVLRKMGDHAAAIQSYEEALQLAGRALPPNHPQLAAYLRNLALTLKLAGRFDASIEAFERAHAVLQAHGETDPSALASLEAELANVRRQASAGR